MDVWIDGGFKGPKHADVNVYIGMYLNICIASFNNLPKIRALVYMYMHIRMSPPYA